MLGVPLGSATFVSDFVEKKLLGRLQDTVDRLVEFEDTQAASYLLRVSYSIVRAVHFMRTTPLEQWKQQAVKFDSMVRNAIEGILGFPMDDRTFTQASLSQTRGTWPPAHCGTLRSRLPRQLARSEAHGKGGVATSTWHAGGTCAPIRSELPG